MNPMRVLKSLFVRTAVAMACAGSVLSAPGASMAQPKRPKPPPLTEAQRKLQQALPLLRGSAWREHAQEALADLEAAVRADPTLEAAQYDLALLYLRLGRKDDARRTVQAMAEALPKSAAAEALLGLVAEGDGDVATAKAHYERAIEFDPAQPLANVWFAAQALHGQRWDEAIRHARLALVGDPTNLNAYHALGLAYYKKGLLEMARLVCLSGLGIDAKAAPLHNLLGLVQLQRNELRDALTSFDKALDADPHYAEAALNAGAVTLSYADFKTALSYFDKALAARPGDFEARLSRAVALRGLGKLDEAKTIYEALIREDPDAVSPRYNLCVLLTEYAQDYPAAQRVCGELEAMLPADHPRKAEMHRRMEGLKTLIEAMKPEPGAEGAQPEENTPPAPGEKSPGTSQPPAGDSSSQQPSTSPEAKPSDKTPAPDSQPAKP